MKLCILNKLGIMSVIALALTLVAASAAFADESSTNIGDASSFQDDAALWAMVDDKAKKDGAVLKKRWCLERMLSHMRQLRNGRRNTPLPKDSFW